MATRVGGSQPSGTTLRPLNKSLRASADLPFPPGPDELPIVGSTFDLMRRPIEFLDDISEYGDIVTYRVAGQRFTALLHPDYIERVLVSENDRFRRWAGEEWGTRSPGTQPKACCSQRVSNGVANGSSSRTPSRPPGSSPIRTRWLPKRDR